MPPFHMDAEHVRDIYLLDELIGPEEREVIPVKEIYSLRNKPKKLKEFIAENQFPEFLQLAMDKLPTEASKQEKKTIIPALLYVSYLLMFRGMKTFHGKLSKNKAFLAEESKIPLPIMSKFLDTFTELQGTIAKPIYTITAAKEAKLINYSLIMYLLGNGYEGDPAIMARQLKLEGEKCIAHFKRIGCSVARKGGALKDHNNYLAKLKVPLTFPTITKKIVSAVPRSFQN